jgi:serine/threonine-protein kinase
VVGAERAEAIAVLKRTGLLADEQATQAEDDKAGLVVAQDPKAGTSVEAGSHVTINVGVVSDTVAIPDLANTAFAKATAILKRAQLRVGAVEPPNPGDDGVVLGRRHRPGRRSLAGLSWT